jgi:hypothetical protein
MTIVGIGRKSAEWRRAEADLAFLDHLREADIGTLRKMARDHELAPQWKRVAIARAVMRLERASVPPPDYAVAQARDGDSAAASRGPQAARV